MREILTYEEHSEVLSHWIEDIVGYPTLISFDRHLDLKLIDGFKMDKITKYIQNNQNIKVLNKDIPYREDDNFAYGLDDFLYVAIKIGLFNKIIWVYPQRMTGKQLAQLLYDVLSLIAKHGSDFLSSFKIYEHGASIKLYQTEICLTNLENLNYFISSEKCIVDIDMDYFYNPVTKKLYYTIDYVLNYLKEYKISKDIRFMTYSVTSGFLPDSYRWIGQYIAKKIGCKLLHQSNRTKKEPLKAITAISTKSKIHEEYIKSIEHELSSLGGVGWKLKSILYIMVENVTMAEKCYEKARENGDYAYWAAYTFGLYYMKNKKYTEALKWFNKRTKMIDTIEAHSLILSLICYYNLKSYEEGYLLAKDSIQLLPMRKEGYEFGHFFSNKTRKQDKEYFEFKYLNVKDLIFSKNRSN